MQNIFTLRNILIYLLVTKMLMERKIGEDLDILGPLGYGTFDTKGHKKAYILGGGIGGIAGMYTFRHKTQKPRFVIGFPLILIIEIICVVIFLAIK